MPSFKREREKRELDLNTMLQRQEEFDRWRRGIVWFLAKTNAFRRTMKWPANPRPKHMVQIHYNYCVLLRGGTFILYVMTGKGGGTEVKVEQIGYTYLEGVFANLTDTVWELLVHEFVPTGLRQKARTEKKEELWKLFTGYFYPFHISPGTGEEE